MRRIDWTINWDKVLGVSMLSAALLIGLIMAAMIFQDIAYGQVVDPLPPQWVAIVPEGGYQGTSPVVTMPAGTIYTFGLTAKVLCDSYITPPAPATVVVWVSSFQATCKVNGQPPSSGNGDPDPNVVKTLYVQQASADQKISVQPYGAAAYTVDVPSYIPTPPVTPPATGAPTVFLCPGVPITVTETYADGTTHTGNSITLPVPVGSPSGATAMTTSNGVCKLYVP